MSQPHVQQSDPTTAPSTPFDVTVSFAAAGWFQIYHLGVVKAMVATGFIAEDAIEDLVERKEAERLGAKHNSGGSASGTAITSSGNHRSASGSSQQTSRSGSRDVDTTTEEATTISEAADDGQTTATTKKKRTFRFSGSSSGALAAAAAAFAVPTHIVDDMADFAMHCAEHYRESKWHLFVIRDYLQAGVRKFSQAVSHRLQVRIWELERDEDAVVRRLLWEIQQAEEAEDEAANNDYDDEDRILTLKTFTSNTSFASRTTTTDDAASEHPIHHTTTPTPMDAFGSPTNDVGVANCRRTYSTTSSNGTTFTSPDLQSPNPYIAERKATIAAIRRTQRRRQRLHFLDPVKKGELEIFITTLPFLRKKILSDFTSVESIEDAVCASCCLSPMAGFPMYRPETEEWVVDGGIASIQPHAEAEEERQKRLQTLRKRLKGLEKHASRRDNVNRRYDDARKQSLGSSTLAPFAAGAEVRDQGLRFRILPPRRAVPTAAATVVPQSPEITALREEIRKLESASTFISVSPFYFSRASIKPSQFIPVWWGMYPPSRPKQELVYALGYNDCISYLVRSGLVGPEKMALVASSPSDNSPKNSVAGVAGAGSLANPLSSSSGTPPPSVSGGVGGSVLSSTSPTPVVVNRHRFGVFKDALLALAYMFIGRPLAMTLIYMELLLMVWWGFMRGLWYFLTTALRLRKWFALVIGEKLGSRAGRERKRREEIRMARRRVRKAAEAAAKASYGGGGDGAAEGDGVEEEAEEDYDSAKYGSYDTEFFRDVFEHGALETIFDNIRNITSARQFLRLLFNTTIIPFNEVRLLARSRFYRVLQPVVFEGNRPMFKWQWYQKILMKSTEAANKTMGRMRRRRKGEGGTSVASPPPQPDPSSTTTNNGNTTSAVTDSQPHMMPTTTPPSAAPTAAPTSKTTSRRCSRQTSCTASRRASKTTSPQLKGRKGGSNLNGSFSLDGKEGFVDPASGGLGDDPHNRASKKEDPEELAATIEAEAKLMAALEEVMFQDQSGGDSDAEEDHDGTAASFMGKSGSVGPKVGFREPHENDDVRSAADPATVGEGIAGGDEGADDDDHLNTFVYRTASLSASTNNDTTKPPMKRRFIVDAYFSNAGLDHFNLAEDMALGITQADREAAKKAVLDGSGRRDWRKQWAKDRARKAKGHADNTAAGSPPPNGTPLIAHKQWSVSLESPAQK